MDRRVRTRARASRHDRGSARALLVAVGFLLASTALSCRSVEPWERAAFAARRMQGEPHAPHQGLLEHVRQSREAMATGGAPSGAVCGCY